jgi:hypothetical protein
MKRHGELKSILGEEENDSETEGDDDDAGVNVE